MDIEIDPLSPVPLYQQLRDRIVEGIGRGDLTRGDALASVRQVAGQFGINPATVAKAYDQLRAEGLVASNAKSGTFVTVDRDTAVPSEQFTEGLRDRLLTLLAEGRAHGLSDAALRHLCDQTVAGLAGARR